MAVNRPEILEEDELVAELRQLGITYLSNRITGSSEQVRPPAQLLADCIRQPSSRVRTAVIAVFLVHPVYHEAVPAALDLLDSQNRQLLKLFYTAAVYLQRQYKSELQSILNGDWAWLPDRYADELGVPQNLSSKDAIRQLGLRHQLLTHSGTNWAGTYENVVTHLIRQ